MLKQFFKSKQSKESKVKTIIVVSGLPRSGTSMMMKMLEEGGLSVLTDALRSADDDNPNGYLEYELVKQLADGNVKWLADADQKVVKVISQLLEYLPPEHRYKIIFMEREIKEVLASQHKMLDHRNEKSQISDAELHEQFQQHLKAVKFWLARQPNIDLLYVSYNEIMANPDNYCQVIADFLSLDMDVSKMRSVPNKHLYRNRANT